MSQLSGEHLDAHRPELIRHCYRMLGCPVEAQDAVQETMLRAWRGADDFAGRSSLRTWLYRIATNVCLDVCRSASRRATPMDLGPAGAPTLESLGTMAPESEWVLPMPTGGPASADPADVITGREGIRLAFIAALQHLPPRQRAVLIRARCCASPRRRWRSCST